MGGREGFSRDSSLLKTKNIWHVRKMKENVKKETSNPVNQFSSSLENILSTISQ
jgi:hypothetical protein